MAKTCDFKTSEASTKAWMRKRKLLTNFLEIPESNLTHFRQQNSYWSKKAFQRHHQAGIKPGDMLFYEEPGAKKVTPNTEMFHRIDADKGNFYQENLKYVNDIKTTSNLNTDVKAGVPELFESNPELANSVYEALGFKSKPDVILPIGTSGSGKSTFIKSLPQENLVVIEPDAMRVEFTGNMNDKSKDKEIYIEAANRAIKAINEGKQVVFDTTNLTKDKRLPFVEAIKAAIPSANIQYKLMELNPELAKQRIKAQLERGENRAAVSDETIDRHASSYKQMLKDIKSEPISNFEITPQQKQQSLQLYSQYLNTIFPDSKVKDIVYHGSDKVLSNVRSLSKEERNFRDQFQIEDGIFFSKEREGSSYSANEYGDVITPAIVNVQNPELSTYYNTKLGKKLKNSDSLLGTQIGLKPEDTIEDSLKRFNESYETTDFNSWSNIVVVFKPEQVHILGSKQDIKEFKKFADNTSKELSDKFVDDLYNLNITPEVITYLYNENGSTHKLLDYGFMLKEMVNSLKSQNRSFVQILDDIKCL